jgi:hypothetical protein
MGYGLWTNAALKFPALLGCNRCVKYIELLFTTFGYLPNRKSSGVAPAENHR